MTYASPLIMCLASSTWRAAPSFSRTHEFNITKFHCSLLYSQFTLFSNKYVFYVQTPTDIFIINFETATYFSYSARYFKTNVNINVALLLFEAGNCFERVRNSKTNGDRVHLSRQHLAWNWTCDLRKEERAMYFLHINVSPVLQTLNQPLP